MKALIISFFMIFSFSALATQQTSVNFTYFGNHGGSQTYYACSYVEGVAYDHLKTLGAMHIQTSCTGGIQPWGVSMPIVLRAKFLKPAVNGVETEIVELEGDTWNPNCDVNARMINVFLKEFDNIKVLKKRDSCPFRTSNYYFKLEIQK